MRRQLGWMLVLVAPCPVVAAQSVAGGFGDALLGPAVVQDTHVLGSVPLASGDLNEDGRADVVACDQEALLMDRFLGLARGGLGELDFVSLPPAAGPFPRPLLGDVTGDGHLDLLVHGTESNNLLVLPGAGDGSFGAAFAAGTLPDESFALRLADSDEDGVLDLLFASGNSNPSTLSWQKGLGDGTFAATVFIGTAGFPGTLVLADLDLDGVPDLASFDQSSVSVRLGLGGGAFGAPQSYSAFAFGGLSATDMDLDGLPDLVHGSLLDVATILHGAGDGTFGASQSVALQSMLSSTATADMDLDGFPDLLGVGGFPASFAARRMGPDGPIGPPHIYELPAYLGTGTLVSADFDGDGLLDVGTTDFSKPALITLTNALGPFVDLGYGTSSLQGSPSLIGSGTPQAGDSVLVQVNAPAFPAPGLLFIGLSTLDVPFAGSTLVPDPILALPVDGSTFLTGTWPAGYPAGVPLYLQSVHTVLGGGKVVSNALMIVPE